MTKLKNIDAPLTKEQQRICDMLCEGKTYKEIQHELGVAYHRINGQISNSYQKLRARNAHHAVSILLKRKYGVKD